MATSKKPQRKYRPRPVLRDPLGYVLESVTPVRSHHSTLVDIKIKNHLAMTALLKGQATRGDMDILINMSNMVEALWGLGFGTDYKDVSTDGRFALLSIGHRAVKHGRFVPTGPEITMLNTLMELHDAQMEVITIADIERAITVIRTKLRNDKDTLKIPLKKEVR